MKISRLLGALTAISVIALTVAGCSSKTDETAAGGASPLPPAPTPNASIPDKYPGGTMPGGGPPAQPGVPAPPPGPK